MKIIYLLRYDFVAQWRYGISVALLAATVAYAAVIASLSTVMTDKLAAFVLYTEPSVLGFFLIGALSLIERREGSQVALAVTPVHSVDYVISKVVSLSLLATFSAAIIAVIANFELNIALLIAAFVTAATYTAFGLVISFKFESVAGYLFGGGFFLTMAIAPGFIHFINISSSLPLWPSALHLRLLTVSLGERSVDLPTLFSAFFWMGISLFGAVKVLRGLFGASTK